MGNNEYKVIELRDLWSDGVIDKIQRIGNYIYWFEMVKCNNIELDRIEGICHSGVTINIESREFDEYSRILLDQFTSLDVCKISKSHYYLKISDSEDIIQDYIIDRTIKIPIDLWEEYES